ncbi:methylase [Longilinea arvoryzae]|uniref:Methylase n=1 Tax=Longilinea arvoryzae TaxID=360412 RepID=A0A0S7BKG0_9CHLR|nr:class I SAM-dependent methyltransferase [Longilinea arvoryzae]GAP14840.1 methylase [Longilinea arvoryzae]
MRNGFARIIARLMSWFFNQLYTRLAWAYDGVAGLVSLGRWQDWVLAMIPHATPSPTLEVGFGPGHLQSALRLRDDEIYGIDLSRPMCNLTRKRLLEIGRVARITRADVENAPFPDETFSRIVTTFPAPYIFSPATARECYRLLKADGVLVVLLSVQMNGNSLPERVIRLVLRPPGLRKAENLAVETIFAAYRAQGFQTTSQWLRSREDDLLVLSFQKPGFIIKGF